MPYYYYFEVTPLGTCDVACSKKLACIDRTLAQESLCCSNLYWRLGILKAEMNQNRHS
jgi:hypothetical protein